MLTKEQYDKEIARLNRRKERLLAARNGSADVKTITVKRHWVDGYYVRTHKRVIITIRKVTVK